MDNLIVAGVLTWAMIFVWWGTDLALRPGRRGKVIGGFLIALALYQPSSLSGWARRAVSLHPFICA